MKHLYISRAFLIAMIALPVLAMLAPEAMAGNASDAEFQTLYEKVKDWSKGYVGRIISVTFVMVGLAAGVLRGSVMGFVVGIAAAVGLFLGPDIINTLMGATLP